MAKKINEKKNNILAKIKTVLENKTAATCAAAITALPCVASHAIAHDWARHHWAYWVLVAGALATSSPKVYRWALTMFGTKLEAFGFIVITELTMIFTDGLLSWAMLAVLVSINAIEGAFKLLCERSEPVALQAATPAPARKQPRRKSTKTRKPERPALPEAFGFDPLPRDLPQAEFTLEPAR